MTSGPGCRTAALAPQARQAASVLHVQYFGHNAVTTKLATMPRQSTPNRTRLPGCRFRALPMPPLSGNAPFVQFTMRRRNIPAFADPLVPPLRTRKISMISLFGHFRAFNGRRRACPGDAVTDMHARLAPSRDRSGARHRCQTHAPPFCSYVLTPQTPVSHN